MITSILRAAGAIMLMFAAYSAAAQQPDSLPPGVGRDIVAVGCTECHDQSAFTGLREDATGWRSVVYDMVLHGAQIGPGEVDTVVSYLAGHFGPGINVPLSMWHVTLLDGPGKDLVQGECSLCHGLDRIAAASRSSEDWTAILKCMMFYGAPVSRADEKTVLAYLEAKYGIQTHK